VHAGFRGFRRFVARKNDVNWLEIARWREFAIRARTFWLVLTKQRTRPFLLYLSLN